MNADEKAAVLAGLLPHWQKLGGKIIVIKYGGNAMLNNELKESVVRDIALLRATGLKPVVVHGGGPEITAALKQFGKQAVFIGGLRVTDEETAAVAEMVLVGRINTELVARLNLAGAPAVGLSGKDAWLLRAQKHLAEVYENGQARQVDIGFVGDVAQVNPAIIHTLVDHGYIPVISPVGLGSGGETYNINADYAAGEIAGALGAEKLILLTDVAGIYEKYGDETSLIPVLTFAAARRLIKDGGIGGGMIPKVEACIRALAGGAAAASIIDGRRPHALLAGIFSGGAGTEVVREGTENECQ